MGQSVQRKELLNCYELASAIVAEAAAYRADGHGELVNLAWDYSNAETARRNLERDRANMTRLGMDYPPELNESLEQHTIRACATCNAFAEAYDSFRNSRT
jgi:hypothetical protein